MLIGRPAISKPVNKHLIIKVLGKVQGVFFRDSTRQKAQELGITGIVKNEPDGSVYIEAEGPERKLHALVAWCHEGPQYAEVEKVETQEGRIKNFTEFKILRQAK